MPAVSLVRLRWRQAVRLREFLASRAGRNSTLLAVIRPHEPYQSFAWRSDLDSDSNFFRQSGFSAVSVHLDESLFLPLARRLK